MTQAVRNDDLTLVDEIGLNYLKLWFLAFVQKLVTHHPYSYVVSAWCFSGVNQSSYMDSSEGHEPVW